MAAEAEYLDDTPEDAEEDYDDEDSYDEDLEGNDYFGDEGVTPLDKHKDLLKELTNFAPYLKDTFNNWLGVTWSEEKQEYTHNPLIKPIMNINGAAWCCGFLKTYTRSNNIITNIRSEEYKFIMADVIEAVWLNLGTRPELGIKSEGDLLRVSNELEHAAALALMGAGDGKYNKMLGTTYSHHTNDNPSSMQPIRNMPKPKLGIVGQVRRAIMGDTQV